MMDRVPEPEVMDGVEQVQAYAEADFQSANQQFLEHLSQHADPATFSGSILDLGCGPGDITIEIARRYPQCEIEGVDGSAEMLAWANRRLAEESEDIQSRVRFTQALLPVSQFSKVRYDAIVSNSLLHHLHDPAVLWKSIKKGANPDTLIMIMDLERSESTEKAKHFVEMYAAEESPVLKKDFYHSLCAAFTPDEVRQQLKEAELSTLQCDTISDRHLLIAPTA